MRASLWFVLIAMLVAGLLVAGCPKQPADEGTPPPAGPTKPAAEKPAPESAEPAKAEFTEDTVRNFMKSMDDQKIEDALNAVGKELGVEDIADTESASPEDIKKVFEKAAESKELDEAVKAHGFKDAKDWVAAATIIFPGLVKATVPLMEEMAKSLGMQEGTPEYDAMMKDAADEFKTLEGVFPDPTEDQIAIISAVLKAEMDKGMAEAGAGAAGDPAAPAEPGAAPTDKPEGEGAAPAEPPTDKPAGE